MTRRPFYEDIQREAPAPAPGPAVVLKPYREGVIARARRALGGEDTRPPSNWPFPTWKGLALRAVDEAGPPLPQRRGPKPKAHNAINQPNTTGTTP